MGFLALLLWPARGLFAYTACALALYLLVVSVSLNELAMDRRNAFLPFWGQAQAERLLALAATRRARAFSPLAKNVSSMLLEGSMSAATAAARPLERLRRQKIWR